MNNFQAELYRIWSSKALSKPSLNSYNYGDNYPHPPAAQGNKSPRVTQVEGSKSDRRSTRDTSERINTICLMNEEYADSFAILYLKAESTIC